MSMHNIRAQKPCSSIMTMEGMLLENRVLTVSQLRLWNGCLGKWAVSLHNIGKSRFISLKAIGNEDGFTPKKQIIPLGENARLVRASDMAFGMKIERGEVVTPLENSPFACIYLPLVFDKRDAVSKVLNRPPPAFKPLPSKIVENPVVELPAHLRRF